jgi:hypothetical protein
MLVDLQASCRVQATQGQASAVVQDELVILHRGEGVYYGLNATGAVVWQALKVPRTIAELTATLQEQFDVTEEAAFGDVQRLVSELLEKKFVELLPG